MASGLIRLRRLKPHEEIQLDRVKEEEIEENVLENGIDPEETPMAPDEAKIQENLKQARIHSRRMEQLRARAHKLQQGFVEEKGPVRQRLGVVRMRRRVPEGTTNTGVNQRKILKRRLGTNTRGPTPRNAPLVGNSNGIMRKRHPLKRLNYNLAEARMQRLRSNHGITTTNNVPIRLRRLQHSSRVSLPKSLAPPNLVVQVDNFGPSTHGQTYSANDGRFKLTLNPDIQDIIRQYQALSADSPERHCPVGPVTPHFTPVYLSLRFSELI